MPQHRHHPDLHPGDKEAEAKFKEINEAHDVLSDKQKRARYDQFGHAAFDGAQGAGGFGGFDASGFDFGDIFDSIFGGGFGFGGGNARNANRPRSGNDRLMRIRLTFEEAIYGCEKDIKLEIKSPINEEMLRYIDEHYPEYDTITTLKSDAMNENYKRRVKQ